MSDAYQHGVYFGNFPSLRTGGPLSPQALLSEGWPGPLASQDAPVCIPQETYVWAKKFSPKWNGILGSKPSTKVHTDRPVSVILRLAGHLSVPEGRGYGYQVSGVSVSRPIWG